MVTVHECAGCEVRVELAEYGLPIGWLRVVTPRIEGGIVQSATVEVCCVTCIKTALKGTLANINKPADAALKEELRPATTT